MPKVVWTPENDRKLLIRLIERSAKAYDTVELAKLFNGATPKAIEERIAKLKREAKAGETTLYVPSKSSPSAPKRKRALSSGGGGGRAGKRGKLAAVMEEEGDDEENVKIGGGGGWGGDIKMEGQEEVVKADAKKEGEGAGVN